MRGALRLLPSYAFMPCTGDNCTFFTELMFAVILISSELVSYYNTYSYTVLLSSFIVISISYAERYAY
jgi:hypothetical protein